MSCNVSQHQRPDREARCLDASRLGVPFLIAVLAALVIAGPARALPMAEGAVNLDWSTFSVVAGDITFVQGSLFSVVSVEVLNSGGATGDSDSSADWGTASASASLGDDSGTAATSSVDVLAQSVAKASGAGDLVFASTLADRGAVFDVNADGFVTFEVDYALSVSAWTDAPGDLVVLEVGAVVQLDENLTPCCLDGDLAGLSRVLTDGDDLMSSASGVLSVSAFFTQGQQGRLIYEAFSRTSASTPTLAEPVPAGLCVLGLLGAGLAGRRRRARPAA